MTTSFFKLTFIFVLFQFFVQTSSCQYAKVFDFSDTLGSYPQGSLVNSGDTLFGTVQWGKAGTTSGGMIYRIKADGTDYKILYDFNGTNGYNPLGGMIIKDNTLYGATRGGTSYKGNLFRIGTNGSNFESFFSFHDTLGEMPATPLLIRGDTIFGVTSYGGKYNQGVLYRMKIDGSNYKKLKDFNMPPTPVIYYNHFLYGVASNDYGGTSIIYRIRTNGSEYEILGEYSSGANATPVPKSPLLLIDSELYGGACAGNTNTHIYKIKPDGSGYEVVYNFQAFSDILPVYSLTYWNGNFFGIGSAGNRIFKVSKDNKQGGVIYSFGNQEGDLSYGSLLLYNDCLYGTTIWGGKQGRGVIYKYNLNSAIPSVQASNIKIDDVTCNQMKISWKRGNGTHCAVFMREGNERDISIPGNSRYIGNPQFGDGSPIINSGWFCVYNGKDTVVYVSGTKPTVQYQVRVCEYNVALLNDEKYNVLPASNNPASIYSPKCKQTIFLDLMPVCTYGDPPFDPEGVSSSGLPVSYSIDNTNVATLQGNMIYLKNTGTANVTATQNGNEFYSPAASVSQQLKVEKALLYVTAGDTSKIQGEANPAFRLKYRGFVKGENVSNLSKQPVISCGARNDSPSGKYEIVVSGGADEHYDFKYINGILTVNISTGVESLTGGYPEIYPNPAENYLHIDMDNLSPCVIQILDLSGRVVINNVLNGNVIDISSLKSGFYLLKINQLTYKFAKR